MKKILAFLILLLAGGTFLGCQTDVRDDVYVTVYPLEYVIDSLFKRMDSRSARILALLGRQPLSVYEVARGLFPRADVTQMYLQLSAAVGHLELLEEEGRVTPQYRDGVLCFRTV